MKIENIKFKAKRLDGKGWACGYFYEENGNIYIIENRQKESMLNRNITYQVDPSTVCQFTGLKDCEGKEIWEGDILEGESKSEVVYTKGTFTISFIGYNKRVFTYPLCYYIKEDGTVDGKVIGNKFDKEK
ncbi:YopX family protein [Segatella copri]|uniref:YopX family protein n=1 Tax=Segatella copri TaxID=165179 RepID=UPI001F350C07|nr:YopX family protein [Segatella copri]MCW4124058.1 YopX family protein [Segatella copri]